METINSQFDRAMAFLAVMESGSFTAAGQRLGCSKAHVSKQVAQLEAALGVQLLFRTTRRLSLTEAGQTYLDYCRRLRDTLDESARAVGALKDEVRGRIRISVPTTFGEVFMGELVVALRARYPELEVDLDMTPQRRDLEEAGIDLALRSVRNVDDHLVAKPLGVTQEWVVAAPAFLARHMTPTTPAQLASLPCILNSHFKEGNRWLFLRGDQQTLVEVPSWLSINNYPLMRQLVLAGQGIARLPRYQVDPDVRAGQLIRLLPDHELPHTPLFIVFPFRQPQPRKVRVAIDFIEAWFRVPGRLMNSPPV